MPWLPLSEILPVTFITCINSNLPFINQSSQLQYFSIIYNTYFTSWLEYFIHPLASEALQTACKFRQGLGYWKCSALFIANLWPMFIFVPRLRISYPSRFEICSHKLLYWSVRWKSFLMRVKDKSEKAGLKLNSKKTKIMASVSITSQQIDGKKKWKQQQILFSCAPKSLWTVTSAMKLKDACSLEGKLWQI